MKTVLDKIRDWISTNELITKDERILCAVSGGKDSVAMVLILKELGFQLAIAHVNFNLRGNESDKDEAFVGELAKSQKVSFHGISFNTEKEKQQGESIQTCARRLRYDWFNRLATDLGFDKIATAHSANDNAETIIYNMSKGTGLMGIMGIPPFNGKVIRPILCLNTYEILDYLKTNNQDFRNDSSNKSDKYSRNKIRHHVLPVLEEINPSLVDTFMDHSDRFQKINAFYQNAIQKEKERLWQFNVKGWWKCKIEGNYNFENVITEHLLPLGFSQQAIIDVVNGENSAQASANEFSLYKNRDELLLVKKESFIPVVEELDLNKSGEVQTPFGILKWEPNAKFSPTDLRHPNYGFLTISSKNAVLRSLTNGDKMQPFGMKGRKLISDLMIDKKLNAIEKQKALVIEFENEIGWWLMNRISENFKIGSNSKKWVKFEWIEKAQDPFLW